MELKFSSLSSPVLGSSTVPQFSSSHLTTLPGGRTMARKNLVLKSSYNVNQKPRKDPEHDKKCPFRRPQGKTCGANAVGNAVFSDSFIPHQLGIVAHNVKSQNKRVEQQGNGGYLEQCMMLFGDTLRCEKSICTHPKTHRVTHTFQKRSRHFGPHPLRTAGKASMK